MKKRLLVFLLTAVLLTACLCLPAAADTGPKPSVTVTFPGLEGTYYATLLSETPDTGPNRADDDFLDDRQEAIDSAEALQAFSAFRAYTDADGYYFIGFIAKVSASEDLTWGYFPPQDFKVLLFCCNTGETIVGEPQSRYAFDSCFTAKLAEIDGQKCIDMQRSYDYAGQMLQFLLRFALTLAVEMLLALAFDMLRFGRWCAILMTNLTTQLLLNAALQVVAYARGTSFSALPLVYFLLELAVFAAEAAAYILFFARASAPEDRRLSKTRCVLYALAANVTSFAAGIVLWLVM